MANISTRTQAVLNALDEQIAELESKLAKYTPLLDELSKLKRTRATLLGERAPAGRRGTLDTSALAEAMQESSGPLTPVALAEKLGVDANTVRSHLNRNVGSRYRKELRGWVLAGDGK